MADWAARRFWTEVSVEPEGPGYGIRLDGRPVRTPAKALLLLPTERYAQAVASEWAAQDEKIDPRTMPFTRTANSALDNVAVNSAEVAALVAEYGGSDLLCYRAVGPAELVARQAADWDPLLDWAEQTYGARLSVAAGVMHIAQPEQAIEILAGQVRALDPFSLAALHDLVALSGSLVIGLAVLRGAFPVEALWRISRIDEDWQAELWGADEEAEDLARAKRADFLHAAAVLDHLS